MTTAFDQKGGHLHIVGIGGAGMSAIARLLLSSGYTISGSDRQSNEITSALQAEGATIYEGHNSAQIAGATALLISSAVKDDNPEVIAARSAGIPVLKRRDAFPLILPDKTQIAVAGTHGKTTTTGLIVHLLRETGNDPSYIVGGVLANTGDNAHAGQGSAFVIEADEYDNMFLGLRPTIGIVTNIEHDHPDMFPTLADVLNSFRQFIARITDNGTLITCADDPNALQLAEEQRSTGKKVITYGIDNSSADWSATLTPSANPDHTEFTIRRKGQSVTHQVSSALAGNHNVLNALVALAAVASVGVSLDAAIPALATFQGTGRRFEIMGQAGGVTVLSDYGHHPTAIRATLQAARQRYPNAGIWAVWQPHTYSRTRLLADLFASSFGDANHALITDIYAAREQPQPGDPTSADLAQHMTTAKHPDARHSGTLDSTAQILIHEVSPGDVVLIFSAGDAPKIGEALLKSLADDQ
jgi:UDP-N-acetylmuramate--alanine ligase